MPHQNTVFRQLANQIPWAQFDRLVTQHRADKGTSKLCTRDLLSVLLFSQFSGAQSTRDIVETLRCQDARRYHSGLPDVARTTLSDALAKRPPEVFTELLARLIPRLTGRAQRGAVACLRLIDSTTVPLSRLSADWAEFSTKLCGAKAHVVFDPDANCPLYCAVTPARVPDITAAQQMPIDADATYCFDLGYYHYEWWAKLDAAGCRIITRLKANTPLQLIETLPLPPAAVTAGVLSDRIGRLPQRLARSRRNPMADAVREIQVEIETGRVLRLFSNDLDAPAAEIAALYKRRWDIELFFRSVKQLLKLRHFLGTSENAVRIQIAVALIAFVLLRLAQGVPQAAIGFGRYGQLVRATLLHRKRLDRLGAPAAARDAAPVRCRAQPALL